MLKPLHNARMLYSDIVLPPQIHTHTLLSRPAWIQTFVFARRIKEKGTGVHFKRTGSFSSLCFETSDVMFTGGNQKRHLGGAGAHLTLW